MTRDATRAERRSWQRAGLRTLDRLLEAAAAADLEPLRWSVDTTTGLRGDVRYAVGASVEEAAAVWQAWVDFLGAEPQRWRVGSSWRVARVAAYRAPGVTIREAAAVEVVIVLDIALCDDPSRGVPPRAQAGDEEGLR